MANGIKWAVMCTCWTLTTTTTKYARLVQIANSNNALRDNEEVHCRALTKLSCNYIYEYFFEMIKKPLLSTINLEGLKYATTVHTVDGIEDLETDIST